MAISAERLQRLTPRQKDCLRLVEHGRQSKSIARELGISPSRVDKHISDARKILGVSDRVEAARLLRIWEHQRDVRDVSSWGAPSLGLPDDRDLSYGQTTDDHPEDSMEVSAPTQAGTGEGIFGAYGERGLLRRRRAGVDKRNDNELGIPATFALLIAVAAVIVAAGAIVSLLLSLSQPIP